MDRWCPCAGTGDSDAVATTSVGGGGEANPVAEHKSTSTCVVSSGRFISIARPYRARFVSAYSYSAQQQTYSTLEGEHTHRFGTLLFQILQRVLIIPGVLDLNAHVIFVAVVLLRQVHRVLEVARLPAHADGRVQVERRLAAVRRGGAVLDERVEPRDVLELGVGVQEERRVVGVGEPPRVQFL